MWHASSRSSVATLQTAIHLLLTYLRWTESSRSTDPHVIGATCDGQTDQCARRMVCRRRRKSTSSSLLQQQGPSWPSAWRQQLLCASPRKPIWHLSSTVSRHTHTHTHTHTSICSLLRSTRSQRPHRRCHLRTRLRISTAGQRLWALYKSLYSYYY